MNTKKYFKDFKNLLNYRTFKKLLTALNTEKRIHFKRIINGNVYVYATKWINGKKGIIIRNLTGFYAVALMIPFEAIANINYNQLTFDIIE